MWPEWMCDPCQSFGALDWSGAFYRRMAALADGHRHGVPKGHLAAFGPALCRERHLDAGPGGNTAKLTPPYLLT